MNVSEQGSSFFIIRGGEAVAEVFGKDAIARELAERFASVQLPEESAGDTHALTEAIVERLLKDGADEDGQCCLDDVVDRVRLAARAFLATAPAADRSFPVSDEQVDLFIRQAAAYYCPGTDAFSIQPSASERMIVRYALSAADRSGVGEQLYVIVGSGETNSDPNYVRCVPQSAMEETLRVYFGTDGDGKVPYFDDFNDPDKWERNGTALEIDGEDFSASIYKCVAVPMCVAALAAQPKEAGESAAQRMLDAINWACGCGSETFGSMQEPRKPRYWWRKELTERAGLRYDGTRYVVNADGLGVVSDADQGPRPYVESVAQAARDVEECAREALLFIRGMLSAPAMTTRQRHAMIDEMRQFVPRADAILAGHDAQKAGE